MRFQPGQNELRKAYVMGILAADPRATFASLQAALVARFGHAMQHYRLRRYVREHASNAARSQVRELVRRTRREVRRG